MGRNKVKGFYTKVRIGDTVETNWPKRTGVVFDSGSFKNSWLVIFDDGLEPRSLVCRKESFIIVGAGR